MLNCLRLPYYKKKDHPLKGWFFFLSDYFIFPFQDQRVQGP